MITSHPVIYQLVRPSTSTLLVHGKFQIILKTHFPHAHIAHTAHTAHIAHTAHTAHRAHTHTYNHIHTTHKQHTHTVRTPYAHHTHTSRKRTRTHTHHDVTHTSHTCTARSSSTETCLYKHRVPYLLKTHKTNYMYIISLTTIYDYITTIN